MDRSKTTLNPRGPKAKISQQIPDAYIALGAKPGTSRDDSKRTIPLPKATGCPSSTAPVDKLKREPSNSNIVNPSKKMKVGLVGSPRAVIGGSSGPSLLPIIDRIIGASSGIEPWEGLAVDCEIADVFDKIVQSMQTANMEKCVAYILGVIKNLRTMKTKPCKVLWSSLISVASLKPDLFSNEHILNAMVNILRRDISAGSKGGHKNNSQVHQIFLNLICHSFSEKENWPEIFVKLYVEDAIGDRILIDSPFAKPFVDNVVTAFHTKSPPCSLLKSDTWTSAARDTSSPLTINNLDDDDVGEQKALVENWHIKTVARYMQAQDKVEQIVLEAIKDLLARRQQSENISKNFVRFLSTACGLTEIRIIGVSRIEAWLHNHKLMKSAQELLAYICYNCSANSQRDVEVIVQLSKLRLKNKPMVNYFNNCLREMVVSFPENLYPLLKYTVYNELSNARNPNNLIVVGALFQVKPDHAADALADICLELLLNKDDYLRSLRALLKEINRILRHDFNLLGVVHALLKERKDLIITIRDHEFRERIFLSLVDLATMCMLLCVSPQVRDAATQSKRDVSVLKVFKMQVSNIQRECVTWLQDSALRIFRPTVPDFHHAFLKVLFLEQAEHYYKVDSWPGENERNLFLRLASEVPLLQATLLRILLIGLSKEHPYNPPEIVDIVDQLIKRAANLPQDCGPSLIVDKVEILDFFFNLCSYNYPENITLPHGYIPPKLAISNIYWKVWLMLLILAAHNPLSIGSLAWNKYPTLRMFMEMCITNHFSFPPPTMLTPEEDHHSKEIQIIAIEKQTILEFESHLAAASTKAEINEQTSLLLPQLMELNPQGQARRPPPHILDLLQNLNNSHKLGHLLCKSRHPDFLLDIMSRQGGTAHMPWLAELVHSSEGVLSHLPVQCLCEYLLSTAPAEKLTKHGQLLAHLRTVVNGPDPQIAFEVLEYLFRRLTSDHGASRAQATKGLGLILSPTEEVDVNCDWLSQYMKHFAHFATIKSTLVQFLRQALQIETNPLIVSTYINFLATQECYENFAEFNDLITDLSSVIIERHSVASYVLPGEDQTTLKNLLQAFCHYTIKAKENAEESYNIHQSYNNEYVIVSWGTGEQCAMQPLVIHSAIVLLTYGPLAYEPYNILLNIWFPLNMEHPRAYSPDTSETTSYLPDWMKLRMIRSNVPRLVDAAIDKLEPPKLVLFIQSFGIPTSSISKLLNTLDKATILDQKMVVDSVLDKTYMIQLVEVQNKRGAIGGEIFVKAIEMQLPEIADINVEVNVDTKHALLGVEWVQQNFISCDMSVELLSKLFHPLNNVDKTEVLMTLIKNSIILKRKDMVRFDSIFKYLNKIPKQLIVEQIYQCEAFFTFINLICSSYSLLPEKIQFAHELLALMPSENATSKILNIFLKSAYQMKNDKKKQLVVKNDVLPILSKSENMGEQVRQMLLEQTSDLEKTGIMVDWLSALELEIASSEQDKLQVDLLFSNKELPFRPLLMSLLLQRASWQSLYTLVTYLLNDESKNICPVSLLDYLTALIKSPKLWQGRDKAVPKHVHYEDILTLNESQVSTVVKCILDEAEINDKKENCNWKLKMQLRLELLLKCIGNHAIAIMQRLFLEASPNNKKCRQLLLMLYMSLPFSGQDDIQLKPETIFEVSNINCPSAVDKMTHYLLSALSATSRSKDWMKKSQDLESCARKLAATHPVLILRHLPMLVGYLKERAQYDWPILKNRGHFLFFGQVLGIMELLQPFIFFQPHTLYDLFEVFFLLLQSHYQRNELNGIVKRVVVFMQTWMVYDVNKASKFLQEHGGILNDIQFTQPSVRPLLSSVSLPQTDQSTDMVACSSCDILVGSVNPPLPETYPERWNQYKIALQTFDSLQALQEIDQLTHKRPQLLEGVSQSLYGLLQSPSSEVRNLALNLTIKWLKYNPKAASEALPSVLSSLESENGDIVTSLLEKLSELMPMMQEFAKIILTKVFQLGIKSTLVNSNFITKSIDLLCLQYGC
ncbi:integrator complex subunit 1 isoform X2 [Anthonomus grandis grandis]|uniref:integrator complex subunit 1 isoform X2 n=1 Tax=Anthonomus grandis grandis TaxID=2921223 RepID=UPI002165DC13|nr:integrator complex subunit 1 isoform X2 [Anthonomus grandis grandis]